ncbi:MAG: sigma-70 family RNA polymerase sigma factor, partial [Acidobacteriota bacterium]
MMRSATPDTIRDEWLVNRARAGEVEAFEALARRFQARLFRHGLHTVGNVEVAADVVQDAWVAIARNLHQLDDPARFTAWAYQIVSNKCRDWLRKEQRRRRVTEHDDDAITAAEAPPASPATSARARVRAGLAKLPADRRAL